jgi:uncharacterized OB-fold protein
MTPEISLPAVNSDTEEWWEATRKSRLLLQHCHQCGRFQHYPRPFCLSCHGTDLGFEESMGQGVIHSFSVVHRSPDPEQFDPPYVVALVRLEEGPVLFTSIVGSEFRDLQCDQPVEVAWRPLSDGRQLPVFSPVKGVA